jgi:glycosyltransferase involved in cell wall biosynthesis
VLRGHDVTLVTTSKSARLSPHSYDRDGLEIMEAPDMMSGRARTGWDPYNTAVRIRTLNGRDFDIVHAFDSRPAVIYPALAVTRRTNAAFFMDWADWWGRGGWIHDRSGWLVRTFFGPIETWFEEAYRRRATAITTISHALRQRSIALGIPAEKVKRIQQGCDIELVQPRDRGMARQRLQLARESRLVLHVGVLTRSDYQFLRSTFAKVRADDPKVTLVLAGRTGIPISNEPSVIVTGELEFDQLLDWLAAADVCVVPARDTIGNRGRWPSKLNDYLAAGRAVVMPEVGDAGVMVKQRGAGWATSPEMDGFARGIRSALQEHDRRIQAEAGARRLAEEELAWPRVTEELIEFYRQAIASA